MCLCSHGNHIQSSVLRSSLSWRICRFNESFAVFLNKSLHSFFFFLFRVLIMIMEKNHLSLQCLVLALEGGFSFLMLSVIATWLYRFFLLFSFFFKCFRFFLICPQNTLLQLFSKALYIAYFLYKNALSDSCVLCMPTAHWDVLCHEYMNKDGHKKGIFHYSFIFALMKGQTWYLPIMILIITIRKLGLMSSNKCLQKMGVIYSK